MEKRQRASQQHFSVDLLEFFDVNDALDVTWAHAVNSQSHLQTALSTEVILIHIFAYLTNTFYIPIRLLMPC